MVYSPKMNVGMFRIMLNVILAIVIFVSAEVGQTFGITSLPLHLSPVWPATGFALGVALLLGYRVWPGILIGNLAYNFHFLSLGSIPYSFLGALAIALGSLAQALIGN